jgi:3-oxoacyl-[acyl-carrier protein] reductase
VENAGCSVTLNGNIEEALSMIAINLSGRTALVTGGTGQLGRTMVRTLAEAGADIIIHYHRDQEQAKQLAEEIGSAGRKVFSVQADVTDETSVVAMRDKIGAAFHLPDIIVNNAVIQYKWKEILDQPLADYESQFRSCVVHNVLMAKAFVPEMVKRKWGRVIGINTECAMHCYKTQSAYVAAKRGMDGVLRVLAKEVAEQGITVNEVAPGWTLSEESRASESDKSYTDRVPFKRRGTDREIANTVAFLASDLASFITGVYLPVCGGYAMPAI